ncbi:MAG: hypothetical protein KAR21_10700 [Spirochaetales bacterium]|nr:hypothetical protein [Spirochaetales bacterium]
MHSKAPVYAQGIALLDLENPSRVLAHQAEPILEPVPNVVFSCDQVEMDERILVYYCGMDTVIGVAELPKEEDVIN